MTEFPELVRWIYPEEVASVMVPCLHDKGFEVSPSNDGQGYIADGINTDGQNFYRAELECRAMYSTDPRGSFINRPEQYAALWDYWEEFLIPCLAKYGIHAENQVSREVFIKLGNK